MSREGILTFHKNIETQSNNSINIVEWANEWVTCFIFFKQIKFDSELLFAKVREDSISVIFGEDFLSFLRF